MKDMGREYKQNLFHHAGYTKSLTADVQRSELLSRDSTYTRLSLQSDQEMFVEQATALTLQC